MAVTLSKDRILDQWSSLVHNGAGNTERIYKMTEGFLDESNLPGVAWKRDQVSTGLFGSTRDFLIVSHRALSEYKMFLSARDYGSHLDCSWYLTCKPGLFKKAISKYATGNANVMSMNLDVFDQQDLSAWASCVHHAFMRSTKELMEELQQDITGMMTRSKGYLSVW
jgi:hypothetical protein